MNGNEGGVSCPHNTLDPVVYQCIFPTLIQYPNAHVFEMFSGSEVVRTADVDKRC